MIRIRTGCQIETTGYRKKRSLSFGGNNGSNKNAVRKRGSNKEQKRGAAATRET